MPNNPETYPHVSETFIVIWEPTCGLESGDAFTVTSLSERAISDMYDRADCDYMDGVHDVLALDENAKLVPVEIGPQERINSDAEFPLYYATAPIMAGKRRVGTVRYSDH